jgi:hypothetical protein
VLHYHVVIFDLFLNNVKFITDNDAVNSNLLGMH